MKNFAALLAISGVLAAGWVLPGCNKGATVMGATGSELTLQPPSSFTIERGGTATAEIRITRKALAGEVSIAFSDLPSGVEVVDSTSRIVGETGVYTFRASDTATLVERSAARVTASGAGNISVSQPLAITVKSKR